MRKLFLLSLGALVILTSIAYSQDKGEKKDGTKPKEEQTSTPEPEKKAHETTFYDVKVTSNRFIFVIDVSGSMLQGADGSIAMPKVDRPDIGSLSKPGARPSIPKIREADNSKLAIAKKELINVINGVSENTAFNIVVFHDTVSVWKDEMLRATKENKGEAVKWVQDLPVGGGTALYDALKKAFETHIKKEDAETMGLKLVHTPGSKTTEAIGADTIYLLSDGDPTAGEIKDPKEIRTKINEMNKDLKIKINCVDIGPKPNDLMKGLAEDSKGTYVHKGK